MSDTIKCVICRRIIDGIEVVDTEGYIPAQPQKALDVHVCKVCARKDKLDKLVKEYRPFMEKFSKFVNNCAYDFDNLNTEALVECFLMSTDSFRTI